MTAPGDRDGKGEVRFNVVYVPGGRVAGLDTLIVGMPPAAYQTMADGSFAVDLVRLKDLLSPIAEACAATMDPPEILQRVEYVITRDRSTITTEGSVHDCPDCRAGVLRALRVIDDDPRAEVVIGTCYWLDPSTDPRRTR